MASSSQTASTPAALKVYPSLSLFVVRLVAVVVVSALGQIADDGTEVFDRTTDSLQAIKDTGNPTTDQIADAVWNEDATAHQTLGTFGQAIGDPFPEEYCLLITMLTRAKRGAEVD